MALAHDCESLCPLNVVPVVGLGQIFQLGKTPAKPFGSDDFSKCFNSNKRATG